MENRPAPWVKAEGIGVKGPRGWAFRGFDLAARRMELTVVSGAAGSGRTSLLLALAGRMKITEGRAEVAGADLPQHMHRVQKMTAVGLMDAVNPLEPELTVAEHVREALNIRHWFGSSKKKVAAALDKVGLDVDPHTVGWKLSPDDAQLLGLAMALTGIPEVVFLDDVDRGLDDDRRHLLWARIAKVAQEHELTVVATCADPDGVDDFATQIVPMPELVDA